MTPLLRWVSFASMNDDAKLCFIRMMPLQCLRELKIMIQEILLRRRNNGKDKSATSSNFSAIDQKGAEAMFGTSWDKKYKIGTRTNTAGRRDLNVPPFDL